MNASDILRYYLRNDVREALMAMAMDREVVGIFKNGSYDKRPNALTSKADVEVMVKSGTMEFHCSVERWHNPMALSAENYNAQRKGWDLILDLDCKSFGHAKIAADVLVSEIRRHDIESVSVKFSGNKGFHIAVPFESFPKMVNISPVETLYPDLARKIVSYLKEKSGKRLSDNLLKNYTMEEILKESDKKRGNVYSGDTFDPFKVIEIDAVLISPRHLFRMPYSINMKTFLVSLPIEPDKIMHFEKEMARPETITTEMPYIRQARQNEASALIAEAMDLFLKMAKKEKTMASANDIRRGMAPGKAVREEFFPPCMKLILDGLSDGRKRSLFILINFLSSAKWDYKGVEEKVAEWNAKNKPPLPESYIRGQLRYYRQKGKPIPPPACTNEAYYVGFNVCRPDHICVTREHMRNPVRYPFRAMKQSKRQRK